LCERFNLLLLRATARQRELTVRMALARAVVESFASC
jgi:hypothetical protein